MAEQFRDFGRGVISLSSVGLLPADRRGHALPEHGADRPPALAGRQRRLHRWAGITSCGRSSLLLAAVGAGACICSAPRPPRRRQPASSSARSRRRRATLIARSRSPSSPCRSTPTSARAVPEAYVQTRLNLLSALREFEALGGEQDARADPRHRAVQRRGRAGREAVRHRRPSKSVARTRGAITAGRHLPGRGRHLRA